LFTILILTGHTKMSVGITLEKSYSVKDVAAILGLSPATVYERITDGLLAAYKDGTRTLVTEGAIIAYRESRPPAAVLKPAETIEGLDPAGERGEMVRQGKSFKGEQGKPTKIAANIVAIKPPKRTRNHHSQQKKAWYE
jgi:excisionase family DNA binding protein